MRRTHRRKGDTRSTTQRGYGWNHQRERDKYAARMKMGEVFPCATCHRPIVHGMTWDLGHTPDRSGYVGPQCSSCNRRDGAYRSLNMQRGRSPGVSQRDW